MMSAGLLRSSPTRVEMGFGKRSALIENLIDSVPGVVYVFDTNARLLFWNRHLEILSGYGPQEIGTLQPLQFIAQDHRSRVSECIAHAFTTGASNGVADFLCRDGTRIPHYFTGRSFVRQGQTCVVGMGINVTDPHWLRRDCAPNWGQPDWVSRDQQGEIMFHLAVEPDEQFRFLTISDEFLAITGLTDQQVVGQLIQQVIPHRQLNAAMDHYRSAVRERRVVRWLERSAYFIGRRDHGEVAVTPLFNSRGNCTSLLVTCSDVTGRIDAAEDLRASESMKSAILESAMDCIITIDAESRVIEFNPAAEQTFGISRADILGKPMYDFIIPPALRDKHRQGMRRYMHSGYSAMLWRRVELTAIRASGEEFPVEVTFTRFSHGQESLFTGFLRDISRRKRSEEQLHQLAYYDSLTGLPNRALFTQRLEQSLAEAARDGRVVGIGLLDLDRFKRINDSLGHSTGDLLLKAVADRLVAAARPEDTVARLSGDEFTMILTGMSSATHRARIAREILNCLSEPFQLSGHELHITGSLGLTLSPVDDCEVGHLLRNADAAMYRAKERAGSSYEFYAPDMTIRADARLTLEKALHRALEQGEFCLEYQPIIDLNDGAILGSEALLRWYQPDGTYARLEELIPMAEDCGLIGRLGEWVLREACAQWRHEPYATDRPSRLAVNISPRQLQQGNLLKTVMRVLEETGFDARRLDLEITETSLVRNTEQVLATMRDLGRLNVQFSVDDFGTGYSNFAYLKNLPIGSVKIDRSFVHDIATNANSAAIARAVLAMARSLGLKVTAEGVETREQLMFLRDHGCDAAQGYYFSRPVSLEKFSQLAANQQRWLPQDPLERVGNPGESYPTTDS